MNEVAWKEPFDVHDLVSHIDPRGFLIELLRFVDQQVPGQGQLYTFSIEPGKRRGDHYHKRKREWFTCVHGRAIVLLSHANGSEQACELFPGEPKIIYVGPGTSHALINETDEVAVIISYGSKQHNPEEKDTYYQTAFESYVSLMTEEKSIE